MRPFSMATTQAPSGLLGEFTTSIVLSTLTMLLVWNAYRAFTAKSPVPPGLPWVGKDADGGSVAEFLATFKSFNNCKAWLNEGYEKVALIA